MSYTLTNNTNFRIIYQNIFLINLRKLFRDVLHHEIQSKNIDITLYKAKRPQICPQIVYGGHNNSYSCGQMKIKACNICGYKLFCLNVVTTSICSMPIFFV